MIWLQSPRWLRWSVALLIMTAALWTEFGGEASAEHPFATVPIASGEEINLENVEMRAVPLDLLDPVEIGTFTSRPFAPGEPITVAGSRSEPAAGRTGWWALEMDLPGSARTGDEVQVVLLDTGEVVPGLVHSTGPEDPLANEAGTVAVPPEQAAAVASAVANGRAVVLLSVG